MKPDIYFITNTKKYYEEIIKKLKQLNISLKNENEEYRPALDIIKDLSLKWEEQFKNNE